MTLYPDGIDSILTLPTVSGGTVEDAAINALRDAVLAIELELGLDPHGIYSDVATRLSILESRVGPGPGNGGGSIDINTQLSGVLNTSKGGTGLNSIGVINTVLTSTGTTLSYKLLDNTNISSAAAIDGSKINPNFVAQNITTTGTIQISSVILGSAGPTITTGTGVPLSTPPNGSIYLRQDGASTTGLYLREAGNWAAVGSLAAGSNTQVQYNSSGSLAGDSSFVYNAAGGITVSDHVSIGSSVATTGKIRLGTNATIYGIAPGGSDAAIIRYNTAGDFNLTIGDDSVTGLLILKASSAGSNGIAFESGGFTVATMDSNGLTIGTNYSLRTSPTSPASSGNIRMAAGQSINIRNTANTADISAIAHTGTSLYFGSANDLNTNLAGSLNFYPSSGTSFGIGGGGGTTSLFVDNNVTVWQGVLKMAPAASNPASSGAIRLTNSQVITSRNAGNTADITLIGTDISDEVNIGDLTHAVNLNISTSGTVSTQAGSAFTQLVTTGYFSISDGSSAVAASGLVRVPNNKSFSWRNAANTGDITALTVNASNNLVIGTTLALGSNPLTFGSSPATSGNIRLDGSASNVDFLVANISSGDRALVNWNSTTGVNYGTTAFQTNYTGNTVHLSPLSGNGIYNGGPVYGDSNAYSSHGGIVIALTGDHILTSSEYIYQLQRYTGVLGAAHTITYPNPTTDAKGYCKFLVNNTDSTLHISDGNATLYDLPQGNAAILWFDSAGVRLLHTVTV